MPEFITLADGSLAVKGRNLPKQSCPLVVGNWINNGGSPAIDNIMVTYGDEDYPYTPAPEIDETVVLE